MRRPHSTRNCQAIDFVKLSLNSAFQWQFYGCQKGSKSGRKAVLWWSEHPDRPVRTKPLGLRKSKHLRISDIVHDLFPRLLPAARETLPSFLSRLAASKGVRTTDLAIDMCATLKRFVNQDAEALSRLISWSRLTEEELVELRSWTGIPAGNVMTLFRNELIGSRSLRNPTVRGCPLCLKEDAVSLTDEPLAAMTLRGDWQLRDVTLCLEHAHPLVDLWTEANPFERMDSQTQLYRILNQILDGSLVRDRLEPSAFDRWLRLRLQTGSDPTWLSGHSLYASLAFCRLLGGEILRPIGTSYRDLDLDLRAVQSAGFEIARRGDNAIRTALEELAERTAPSLGDYPSAYGRLFISLSHGYKGLPDFDGFRDILRDVILSVWPVGADEVLLGQPVLERHLHSVTTAARETGIGETALDRFLTAEGVFTGDDNRPTRRKTFPAKQFAPLLAEAASLVTAINLAMAIGASRREISALIRSEVLRSRYPSPTVNLKWHIPDGLALIADLDALAQPITSEEGCLGLQQASAALQRPVGAIIGAIRQGELQLGRAARRVGYNSFMLRFDQLERWASAQPAAVKKNASALPGVMSLPEFARSVGLRDSYQALVNAGHIAAFEIEHPITKRAQFRVTQLQIDSFHKEFLTPTTMEVEFGLHRNTILGTLRAAGIQKLTTDGHDFGPVYRRSDVESAFRKAGFPNT